MPTITATALARNTSSVLDRVTAHSESIEIVRNRTVIARIVPPVRTMTAAEAIAGLGGGLTKEQAESWLRDSRNEGPDEFDQSIRDPWE
jgi:antitoxin (DNA-binding transcriptional repressor) of toxin-antitoxin stability system